MKISKTRIGAQLAILMLASALTAGAQGFSLPSGRTSNFSGRTTNFIDWNESFEGSTGSSGQEMVLNSLATYHFGRFSVGAGIPVYLNRSISPNKVTISNGIGNAFVMLGSSWNGSLFNYGTVLTVSVPTGDPSKGFGTGHVTFDWNNRIDHDFGGLSPFVDAGV